MAAQVVTDNCPSQTIFCSLDGCGWFTGVRQWKRTKIVGMRFIFDVHIRQVLHFIRGFEHVVLFPSSKVQRFVLLGAYQRPSCVEWHPNGAQDHKDNTHCNISFVAALKAKHLQVTDQMIAACNRGVGGIASGGLSFSELERLEQLRWGGMMGGVALSNHRQASDS